MQIIFKTLNHSFLYLIMILYMPWKLLHNLNRLIQWVRHRSRRHSVYSSCQTKPKRSRRPQPTLQPNREIGQTAEKFPNYETQRIIKTL